MRQAGGVGRARYSRRPMIDLKALRENPDRFREGARLKNYDPSAVDRALDADARRVAAQQEHDALKAEQNQAGKAIGKLLVTMS